MRWSLQEIARELGEPVHDHARAHHPAGARKPPLPAVPRAHPSGRKPDFERRLADSRTALKIAARVRAEAEAG